MEKYKKYLKFDGIDKPRGPFENFKSIKEAKTDDIFRWVVKFILAPKNTFYAFM